MSGWDAARLIARQLGREPGHRLRDRQASIGMAFAGAVGLAAVSLAAMRDGGWDQQLVELSGELVPVDPELPYPLVRYVEDPGTRGGVAIAALLLVVPFVSLTLQFLRLGNAARRRRLALLSLNGATRADLRRVAMVDSAIPAVRGMLFAVPVYLVLWLVLGPLPTLAGVPGLLPVPGAVVVLGWVAVALVLVAVVSLSAARSVGPVELTPLGAARRAAFPLGTAAGLAPWLWLALAVVSVVGMQSSGSSHAMAWLSVSGAVIGVVGFAVTLGPLLMALIGRVTLRRPRLSDRIVGRRLVRDPRTPGRVSGVLMACGIVIAASVTSAAALFQEPGFVDDIRYYLGGYVLALVAALLVVFVMTASLVSGAAEQVLDDRRSLAVMTAFGVSVATLSSFVARQLRVAAVPPALIGTVFGWPLGLLISGLGVIGLPVSFLSLGAAALLVSGTAFLAARIAAAVVRPDIAGAASAEHLRAP